MDKALMAIMGGVLALGMIAVVAGMAQAGQPVAEYCCPLCPECFFTYEELYQHFTTEHPAEDITIIWE